MGHLLDGKWTHEEKLGEIAADGSYRKRPSRFRNWITRDGSAGPSGAGGYRAETGRYHLYASPSCPWAHRAVLFRVLKKLEDIVPLYNTEQSENGEGWGFQGRPHRVPGTDFEVVQLHQVYSLAEPGCTSRVTVPTLWDSRTRTIVSNESSEIIRMFNSAFVDVAPETADLYPPELADAIDEMNAWTLDGVNNAVNEAGRCFSQAAYEAAFDKLFATLDALDDLLGRQRYLCGDRQTEADWRLYPNLIRFDPIYVNGYRCNLRRIADYPNLSNYLRDLYQTPGIAAASDIEAMKAGVFAKAGPIGWNGIIPKGPEITLDRPHDRDRFDALAVAG